MSKLKEFEKINEMVVPPVQHQVKGAGMGRKVFSGGAFIPNMSVIQGFNDCRNK